MASRGISKLSRQAIRSLHSSYTLTAQSFQSYNFREYFMRVTDRKFGTELEQLGLKEAATSSSSSSTPPSTSSPQAGSSSSTPSSSSSSPADDDDLLSSMSQEQRQRIQTWWNRAITDLEQWKRSSVVNNLFVAPKLVVEGAGVAMIQGGGGAGMEASPGGAGQDVQPATDVKSA